MTRLGSVRGLLVVNPRATTTSPRATDVIVHALSDEVDLDVTVTTHRGHAVQLGQGAREQGLDIVLTLGGDGVVNEVVNGMLHRGPGPDVPLLAPIPGGSANVFARSLGVPTDPVEATGLLLDRLREGTSREVGLGTANDRWFVANAGLGIDAEVIAAMERHRSAGHEATPTRYLMTTLTEFFRGTNRKEPALTLSRPAGPHSAVGDRVDSVFLAFVQNTAPWTYFGTWPISPCPEASFDTGLDVFVARRLRRAHGPACRAAHAHEHHPGTRSRRAASSGTTRPGSRSPPSGRSSCRSTATASGSRPRWSFAAGPEPLRVIC